MALNLVIVYANRRDMEEDHRSLQEFVKVVEVGPTIDGRPSLNVILNNTDGIEIHDGRPNGELQIVTIDGEELIWRTNTVVGMVATGVGDGIYVGAIYEDPMEARKKVIERVPPGYARADGSGKRITIGPVSKVSISITRYGIITRLPVGARAQFDLRGAFQINVSPN